MNSEKKIFLGGLNSDDQDRRMPKEDYRDALNCRIGSTKRQNLGAEENVFGMAEVVTSWEAEGEYTATCGEGFAGLPVTRKATYISYAGPEDALAKATAMARELAEAALVCESTTETFFSDQQQQQFRRNCQQGYTGSLVTYTVPANAFTSTVSKADANTKANTYMQNNGQRVVDGLQSDPYGNVAGVCELLPGRLFVINSLEEGIILDDLTLESVVIAPGAQPVAVQNAEEVDLLLTRVAVRKANESNFTEEDNIRVYILKAAISGQPSGAIPGSDGTGVSPLSIATDNYTSQFLEEPGNVYGLTASNYQSGQSFVVMVEPMPVIEDTVFNLSGTVNNAEPGPFNLMPRGGTIVCTVTRSGPGRQSVLRLTLSGNGTTGVDALGGLEQTVSFLEEESKTVTFSNVTWNEAFGNPGLLISMTKDFGDDQVVINASSLAVFIELGS